MATEFEVVKSTAEWIPFFLVDTDFITMETGKTYSDVTIKFWREGESSPSTKDWNAGVYFEELGEGLYEAYWTASEIGSNKGRLKFIVKCTGCLPWPGVIDVVDYKVGHGEVWANIKKWLDVAVTLSSGNLPNTNAQAIHESATAALRLEGHITNDGVTQDLYQALPGTPTEGTVGDGLKQASILEFTGSDVKATLDGEEVTVGTNNDKTGYRLSTTGVQDVWEYTTRALTDKAGFTISGTLTTLDSLKTQLNTEHGSGSWETATGFSTHSAADVWSVGTRALTDKAGFTLSGTIQTFDSMKTDLNTSHGSGSWETATGFSTHTAAQVADAVWDELVTGHTGDGSFGKILNTIFQEGVSAKDVGSTTRAKLGQFYKRVNYSTFTEAGKPKTGTVKYYSNNTDFTNDENPIVTFNFTATWSSEESDAYITEFELQKT